MIRRLVGVLQRAPCAARIDLHIAQLRSSAAMASSEGPDRAALFSLNACTHQSASELLYQCLPSTKWADRLSSCRPFTSLQQLQDTATSAMAELSGAEWVDVLSRFPPIDPTARWQPPASSKVGNRLRREWATSELCHVLAADAEVRREIHRLCVTYKAHNGFPFVVCVERLNGHRVLDALRARVGRDETTELATAKSQAAAIASKRLGKLLRVLAGSVRYVSCRDTAPNPYARRFYTFEQSIFCGWAEDGGMIMPQPLPKINAATLVAWKALSYPELCYEVMRLFIPEIEISNDDLRTLIVRDAFRAFGDDSVVRMRDNAAGDGIHVCELWHGPTLAFKDLGMQVLARLLQHFLARSGQVLNLLVGTSGDTGSSAIEAVRSLSNVSIAVLYPKGRGISLLQELQMTTVGEVEPRVHVIGVEGSSDDLDVAIEEVFADVPFRKAHSIGSTNSVNICRVLVQIVHYFWSYLRVCDRAGRGAGTGSGAGAGSGAGSGSGAGAGTNTPPPTVAFSVPSGACGHVTAGAIARAMGLPMATLHAATNANDIFHRLVATGSTKGVVKGRVVATCAPSMDIMMPYNVERLLYLAVGGEHNTTAAKRAAGIMREFKTTGMSQLPVDVHAALLRVCGLTSSCTADSQCADTIRRVFTSTRREGDAYVLDPHTAMGVHAALTAPVLQTADHVVCMACAHPSKFSSTVVAALEPAAGGVRQTADEWWWLSESDRNHVHVKSLLRLLGRKPVSEEYKLGMNWADKLRQYFEQRTAAWARAGMGVPKSRL